MQMDEERTVIDNLIKLLRVEADRIALKSALKEYHPADIADALEDVTPETKKIIMESLDIEQTAAVLDEVNETEADEYIEEMPVETLAELVDAMPADDAADILEYADEEKAEAVISYLDPEHAEDVRELRSYDPDTAGGIMTTEFFWVKPDETAASLLQRLRDEHEEAETIHEIYVCREDMKLKGLLFVEDLISAQPTQTAGQIMDKATITVYPTADQEVCARYMQKYDLSVLPVIDPGRRLLGIITFDDILEVMSDEASEDMYRLAGVGDSRPLEHGSLKRAYHRLPWLITTLIGMCIITPVISHTFFADTLKQFVALCYFLPGITGLSGNAGIQSSTVVVRGLATGEIDFGDLWHMLKREITVGIIIASICSMVIGVSAYFIAHGGQPSAEAGFAINFAITIGGSMFVGIMSSVLLGICTPMFCQRIKIDPAMASGPFVTTLIDIGAQTIYLGLATYLLMT